MKQLLDKVAQQVVAPILPPETRNPPPQAFWLLMLTILCGIDYILTGLFGPSLYKFELAFAAAFHGIVVLSLADPQRGLLSTRAATDNASRVFICVVAWVFAPGNLYTVALTTLLVSLVNLSRFLVSSSAPPSVSENLNPHVRSLATWVASQEKLVAFVCAGIDIGMVPEVFKGLIQTGAWAKAVVTLCCVVEYLVYKYNTMEESRSAIDRAAGLLESICAFDPNCKRAFDWIVEKLRLNSASLVQAIPSK